MRSLTQVERQWTFTQSALQNTPSRDDGITLEDELKRRKTAVVYMRSLALRAEICDPHDPMHLQARGVLTVGATLSHRFYMRRSMADFKEKYVAASMLFMASKIEEEALKLRYIVNTCLAKWEHNAQPWEPHGDKALQQPSPEYQRWERNILSTEEIVLDALCFDLCVEQPWVILRRSIRGLDELVMSRDEEAESSNAAEERARIYGNFNGHSTSKGKGKLSDRVILDLAWTFMNEAHLTPLPILHAPSIFAFAIFALIIAMVDQNTLPDAYAAASELGSRFGLDIDFSETDGAIGSDLSEVESFVKYFCAYCEMGLIDEGLLQLLDVRLIEHLPSIEV